MARDAGLMDRARETGESVFSIYSWERPTLSFGRNQTAKGHYDLNAIADRGIEVVRRPTGGRALLHHREVTYSVSAPISRDESLNDAYRRINRILLHGLEKLGVAATEAGATDSAPRPGMLPCFATPSEGELVSGGSKLVGSAQYRENGAFLQHGSILIEDDQAIIAVVSLAPAADHLPKAATLTGALGRSPTPEEVAAAMFASLGELEAAEPSALSETEIVTHTKRHMQQYHNELWTWRR